MRRLFFALAFASLVAPARADFFSVPLKDADDAAAVAARAGATRWLGLGSTLVVECAQAPAQARKLEVPAGAGFALVLSKHHPLDESHAPVAGRIVARHAGVALAAVAAGPLPVPGERHLEVRAVSWNRVLVGPARAVAGKAPASPHLDAMVSTVTAQQVQADIEKLVSFKTRHTLSQGYRDAADWCEAQLKAAGLETSRVAFAIGGRTAENVVGELKGEAGGDVYIVGAHLDSINFEGSEAPGADDNASGSACVLAIARAFRGKATKATIRFMFYGGEEEDLLGSTSYVKGLSAAERARIKGALVLDMTAFHRGAAGLMLEGRAMSSGLADAVASAAAKYTALKVERTLEAWGSDHVPFLDEGIPALLTFELDYPENGNQHSGRDTMAIVDVEQAAAIARADVAALGSLVGVAR